MNKSNEINVTKELIRLAEKHGRGKEKQILLKHLKEMEKSYQQVIQ